MVSMHFCSLAYELMKQLLHFQYDVHITGLTDRPTDQPTKWSRDLLDKLTDTQLVRQAPPFMDKGPV